VRRKDLKIARAIKSNTNDEDVARRNEARGGRLVVEAEYGSEEHGGHKSVVRDKVGVLEDMTTLIFESVTVAR